MMIFRCWLTKLIFVFFSAPLNETHKNKMHSSDETFIEAINNNGDGNEIVSDPWEW